MATDRDESMRTPEREALASSTPGKAATPPHLHDQSWIVYSLGTIQEQINRIEDRLRRFERFVWMSHGVMITVIVIWAVVQFLQSNFQFEISPKP